VPTVIEAGLPRYLVITWYGIMVPAGTPRGIVTQLYNGIVQTMRAQEVRERLAVEGNDPIATTPEQFTAFINSEISLWGKVIKDANIVAE